MAVPFADARFPGAPAGDEPTITLRASDPAFLHAVRAYARATADFVSPHGETTSQVAAVVAPINTFVDQSRTWRRNNGHKNATV
jgi:hypothetical protein